MGTVRKKCAYCGKEFTGLHSRRYCSEECKKLGYTERLRKEAEKKKQNRKKPARKKGKPNQEIIDIAVLARQAGMTYGQYVAQFYRR